jgi:CubicO group peptidase (beta-lactamase class C family)
LTHATGFETRETALQAVREINDLQPLGQLLAQYVPARVRPPGELTAYSNYAYTLEYFGNS